RCGNRLVEVAPPPRDDHCPCALDRAQPALNLQRHAALGAQRSALGGADLEIVPGHTQLGPAQGEDLDGDGELEGAEPVVGENGDGSVPGRHWQSIAEPWQNCQRRARAGDGRLGGYGRSTCRRCLRGLRSPKSRRCAPPTSCATSAVFSSSKRTAGTSTPRLRSAVSCCSTSTTPSSSVALTPVGRYICR